jgi:hypothetical protein
MFSNEFLSSIVSVRDSITATSQKFSRYIDESSQHLSCAILGSGLSKRFALKSTYCRSDEHISKRERTFQFSSFLVLWNLTPLKPMKIENGATLYKFCKR